MRLSRDRAVETFGQHWIVAACGVVEQRLGVPEAHEQHAEMRDAVLEAIARRRAGLERQIERLQEEIAALTAPSAVIRSLRDGGGRAARVTQKRAELAHAREMLDSTEVQSVSLPDPIETPDLLEVGAELHVVQGVYLGEGVKTWTARVTERRVADPRPGRRHFGAPSGGGDKTVRIAYKLNDGARIVPEQADLDAGRIPCAQFGRAIFTSRAAADAYRTDLARRAVRGLEDVLPAALGAGAETPA